MENNQLNSPISLHKGQSKDTSFQELKQNGTKKTISKEDILSEADKVLKNNNNASKNIELFTIQAANKWIEEAKERPRPKMLCSEFWHEGETCILFADTNTGKSIFAVQIANSISKGEQIPGFVLEADKQAVLYFDFELSDKQFENRYSEDFKYHYQFDNKFKRAEINPDALIPDGFTSFESYLNYSLERSVIETGAKILIIDNLTYLRNETEKAKDALPLMKQLKALTRKYKLSILALAHTPKRDLSKPISRNDLQGSKMLINFCDSAFSIGESQHDKNIRYLKQIKARNTEIIYDTDNVCTCLISKPDNFLHFDFRGYSTEREHLKQFSEKDRDERIKEAIILKSKGFPNSEIARKFGVSEGAVRKWLKKANEAEKNTPDDI